MNNVSLGIGQRVKIIPKDKSQYSSGYIESITRTDSGFSYAIVCDDDVYYWYNEDEVIAVYPSRGVEAYEEVQAYE